MSGPCILRFPIATLNIVRVDQDSLSQNIWKSGSALIAAGHISLVQIFQFAHLAGTGSEQALLRSNGSRER